MRAHVRRGMILCRNLCEFPAVPVLISVLYFLRKDLTSEERRETGGIQNERKAEIQKRTGELTSCSRPYMRTHMHAPRDAPQELDQRPVLRFQGFRGLGFYRRPHLVQPRPHARPHAPRDVPQELDQHPRRYRVSGRHEDGELAVVECVLEGQLNGVAHNHGDAVAEDGVEETVGRRGVASCKKGRNLKPLNWCSGAYFEAHHA